MSSKIELGLKIDFCLIKGLLYILRYILDVGLDIYIHYHVPSLSFQTHCDVKRLAAPLFITLIDSQTYLYYLFTTVGFSMGNSENRIRTRQSQLRFSPVWLTLHNTSGIVSKANLLLTNTHRWTIDGRWNDRNEIAFKKSRWKKGLR